MLVRRGSGAMALLLAAAAGVAVLIVEAFAPSSLQPTSLPRRWGRGAMAPRMLATGDAPVVLPAVTQPTATVAEIPSVTQRSPTPTSLADRLAGVQQRDDGALGTVQLVASSSLDLDIPVMKASSSASLLQAALLVLAVPAMIFAAMQLANAEEGEGGGKAGGANNEGLGTPEILNKLYQDIEKDFQDPAKLARTSAADFVAAKSDYGLNSSSSSGGSSSKVSPATTTMLSKQGGGGGGAAVLERPVSAPAPVDVKKQQQEAAAAAKAMAEKGAQEAAAAAKAKAKAAEAKAKAEREALEMKKRQEEEAAAAQQAAKEAAAEAKREAEEKARLEQERKEKEAAVARAIVAQAKAAEEAKKRKAEQEKRVAARKVAEEKERAARAKRARAQKVQIEAELKKKQEVAAAAAAKAAAVAKPPKAAAAIKPTTAPAAVAMAPPKATTTAAAAAKKGKEEKATTTKEPAVVKKVPAATAKSSTAKEKGKSAKGVVKEEEDSAEWAEMRRLERESKELLNLSPLMGGGLAAAASAPPLSSLATAPEAELVKRGRKAAASAAVAASAAASAVPSAGKGTKAATKREAEAERKELLKGLDAVMEDLQRRADDRRRKELEEREVLAKGKGKAKGAKEPVAAVSGGETKALGDGSAAGGRKKQAGAVVGGEEAAMAMAAASKLTIPLLKSFIGGINERALPAGKAKKEEYVRTASELLVEKAKASGSMAEALKSLPSK